MNQLSKRLKKMEKNIEVKNDQATWTVTCKGEVMSQWPIDATGNAPNGSVTVIMPDDLYESYRSENTTTMEAEMDHELPFKPKISVVTN